MNVQEIEDEFDAHEVWLSQVVAETVKLTDEVTTLANCIAVNLEVTMALKARIEALETGNELLRAQIAELAK